MPNFIIIGAAKSGTTSLYEYIAQHPQIFMSPIKEPQFFSFEGEHLNFYGPGVSVNKTAITTIEDYQSLFQKAANEIAIGEASTTYLYVEKASERIKHYIPDVKLIALLRNPVDRAYASFMHLIRDGREPLKDFDQALEAEENRIKNNWGFLWRYKDMGFYSTQLKRYFTKFERGQIKVYIYDDFLANPAEILADLFNFLEVDSSFTPNMSLKYNTSGIPKNRPLYDFLNKPNFIKSIFKPLLPESVRKQMIVNFTRQSLSPKPQLLPETKSKLLQLFCQDILELQELIHRDLSLWLK